MLPRKDPPAGRASERETAKKKSGDPPREEARCLPSDERVKRRHDRMHMGCSKAP